MITAISAAMVWAGQLIGYAIAGTIGWPTTLWAGSLLFTAGAGAALGAVRWAPTTAPDSANTPAPMSETATAATEQAPAATR